MANFQLPASISSSEDLASLIVDIKSYANWFSSYIVSQKSGVKPNSTQPEISPAAAETIRAWAGNSPLTNDRLDEFVRGLERIKQTAPSMTITLAGPAPSQIKKQLVNWCRSNIEPSVLISFRFNRTILGGMVVHYNSRIHDWSLRRAILDNKSKFPEALANVR